jgi:hypothetical protein
MRTGLATRTSLARRPFKQPQNKTLD